MVRLTAELIEQSAQYTNPVRDRELDLRGYRIPVLENLGATLDQFDTIDFSDNDIRKLDGFPLLKRLKNLLFNNNRIVRIGDDLEQSIPNLESLILTNNGLQELGDLDSLSLLPYLEHLSLLRNPVTTKKNYRFYVIHKVPQIRVLDFQRIKLKERQAASKLFKGKKGQQLAQELGKRSKTFTVNDKLPDKRGIGNGPSKEEIESIKKAIANAKSLDEVERLNQMLKSGQVPGKEVNGKRKKGNEEEEEEEMDM